ncbi:MAG TPA: YsnF/AvaK domain-containing protein [Planococcus sp. (in: firmicutes)]|nr:YsnF/AvaK domain-containing protein [Planococcus sp. (in: firmicutes)]
MAEMNDKLLGIFELQSQAFIKIQELKEDGFMEEDMQIFAKDRNTIDVLLEKTEVNYSTSENGDWKGDFQSVFSSDDTSRGAYTDIGETHNGTTDYNQHIEEGKVILYVDSNRNRSTGYQNQQRTSSGATEKDSEESIRLHEERLNVEKDRVQTGEVKIGKHLVEEEKKMDVPIEREEVYIERRPVNEEVSSDKERAEAAADKNIHIPVSKERVNVSKEEIVTEELVVGKKKIKDTEQISETVRKEKAHIEESSSKKDTNRFKDK